MAGSVAVAAPLISVMIAQTVPGNTKIEVKATIITILIWILLVGILLILNFETQEILIALTTIGAVFIVLRIAIMLIVNKIGFIKLKSG